MGTAPIGYVNKTDGSGKKIIAPVEPQASIMKWAFNELSKGIYPIDQVRKMANKKGLKCSKNNFWKIIRNPVYCGKILIPKYKDEEEHMVQGLHQPLISESLFYDVQDAIKRNGKAMRTKIFVDENYPLRGFLVCKCGKLLTASASKGRSKYYHYYHSYKSSCECDIRIRTEYVHKQVQKLIKRYTKPLPEVELYKRTIISLFNSKTQSKRSEIKNLKDLIEKANTKISKARDLLLSDAIEADDYRIIKRRCEEDISRAEAKLTSNLKNKLDIKNLLNRAFSNLSKLYILYKNGNVLQKRKIIGSMFPEKLEFDGSKVRTVRLNQAIELISLIYRKIKGIKKGTNLKKSDVSPDVTPQGFKPRTAGAEIQCSIQLS